MQPLMKRKLLDVLSSGLLTQYEKDAFRKWYEQDIARPFTLSPKQVNWLQNVYNKTFGIAIEQTKRLMPTEQGAFRLVKPQDEGPWYIQVDGTTIPVPISRSFGAQVIYYLNEAHESGGLEHALLALPPPGEETRKENTTTTNKQPPSTEEKDPF